MQVTDIEVLTMVINTLENINVPTKYAEEITIPIKRCTNLLKALNDAVKKTAEEKKSAEEVPELEENEVSEAEPEETEN